MSLRPLVGKAPLVRSWVTIFLKISLTFCMALCLLFWLWLDLQGETVILLVTVTGLLMRISTPGVVALDDDEVPPPELMLLLLVDWSNHYC